MIHAVKIVLVNFQIPDVLVFILFLYAWVFSRNEYVIITNIIGTVTRPFRLRSTNVFRKILLAPHGSHRKNNYTVDS